MAGEPIVLLALDESYEGVIRARRDGEPSFSHVQVIGDAYLAAETRGVRVVIPERLVAQLRQRGELPLELPSLFEVRSDGRPITDDR